MMSESMAPLKITRSVTALPRLIAVELTVRVVPSAMVRVPAVKLSLVSERRNWRESKPSRVSASDPAMEVIVIVFAPSSGVMTIFAPAIRSMFPSLLETPSREERITGVPVKLDRKSTRLNSSHRYISYSLFFFNDAATTEIYTLSLHDALPICSCDQIDVSFVVGDPV